MTGLRSLFRWRRELAIFSDDVEAHPPFTSKDPS